MSVSGGKKRSNLLGVAMIPVIVFLFVTIMLLGPQLVDRTPPSRPSNESLLNNYVDIKYDLHFGNTSASKDALVILVVTEENCRNFSYITRSGDHIADEIGQMLGDSNTVLGHTMNSCINQSGYANSLDANLAKVMDVMAGKIAALELDSSLTCRETHSAKVQFVNQTQLSMNETTMQDALQRFCDTTGIPVVLVVATAQEVFTVRTPQNPERGIPTIAIAAAAAIAVLAVTIVVGRKKQKTTEK